MQQLPLQQHLLLQQQLLLLLQLLLLQHIRWRARQTRRAVAAAASRHICPRCNELLLLHILLVLLQHLLLLQLF